MNRRRVGFKGCLVRRYNLQKPSYNHAGGVRRTEQGSILRTGINTDIYGWESVMQKELETSRRIIHLHENLEALQDSANVRLLLFQKKC